MSNTNDLTIQAACAELACANSTLWKLIKRGELAAYRVGRVSRIRRESINEFKDRNVVKIGIAK